MSAFASKPGSREPSPAVSASGFDPSRIQEVLSEGDGFWRTCSGCHESEDGYDVGDYPYSDLFKCKLGGGCGDCGGIGAVWDDVDYEEFARWSREQDGVLDSQIRHLKNMARGICEALGNLKSRTMGRDPKLNAFAYAEVPDWLLRQWLERVGILESSLASGMSAGTAETAQQAQGVARQPDPQGDAPTSSPTPPEVSV